MSAGLFRGTKSRENGTDRGRARALLVLGGAVGLAGILGVVAQATAPPAYDATARITPALYYIGDTTGSVYQFTVTNTGTTAGIGAVEIRRPTTGWSVSGCVPPAGWTSQLAADKCRFRSAASTSDDVKPGQSRTFKLGAKTAAGNVNRAGTWPVVVSKSNQFDNVSLLRNARSTGSGLSTTLYTFELTTAVVSDTLKAPGTTCPAADKDAVVGATTNVIVCGRNRANVALAPSSAYSSLSGTFLKTSGTFSSGTIQPNSGNVVLGRWTGAVVSETFGSGRKLVTTIGAASNRTSPLRTFTGYSATSAVPVAVADSFTTDEDAPYNAVAPGLLANDTNAEAGETLTVVDVTQPAHGTVTVSPNGAFTYTPNADYNGPDSFTYKAFDTYTKSGAATVSITVTPVNDAPVVTDLSASTPEDTAKVVVLSGTDVDSPSLSYTIVSDPTHGTVGTPVGNTVTYTPNPNYNGPDSFTFKANDGSVDSNVSTASLTVDAVNDAPVGVDDAYTAGEDATLSVPSAGVLGNDTDVELSTLTATLVTGPEHAQSFTLNSDGSFDYTPVADFTGPDTFTYTAGDGGLSSAVTTVTITVDNVNDAPVAQAVSVAGTEDSALPVTLLATDADGTTPTYAIVTGPAHGSLGAITGDSVTYTPDANYSGPDSFSYKASDGTLESGPATVTIALTAVNDLPVADDDAYSTNEDTPLTVAAPGVLDGDSDVEGAVTAVPDHGPSHGTLTLNPDGSFTYTPDANFSGEDSFTYAAKDSDGATTPVATVTLTVNPVNDAPTATAAMASADEDTATAIALSGGDVEGAPLTYSIVTGPAHGSLGAITGSTVTYTPDADYYGPDSFEFRSNDGTLDSDAATISITVNPVNDAPVQVDDAYVTNEDTALTVPADGVLGNDFDVDNAQLTAILVDGPAHGTLLLEGDGSFLYTPSANYNGPDSFSYRASDDLVESAPATVTLTVNAVNDVPTAVAGSATTNEDTAKTVTLAGSDPVEGSPVTFAIVTGPAHGSLGAISGDQVTYTPDADYNGPDSFEYKAEDGTTDSAPATFSLTVSPVNDAPSFTKGPDVTVVQDSGAHTAAGWATGIAAGPADEAGQALTFSATAADTTLFSAQPAVAPNGDLTFTPAPGVTGSTTVTVTLSDGAGGTDTSGPQTFTITISPPNFTPLAQATSASGNEDGGAMVVTLTGTDQDGDALTFAAANGANGVVTTPAGVTCSASIPSTCTATVTYTPNANFNGTDTFTYTVNDGTVSSAAGIATMTVNPVNDVPSFTKGANQSVNEDAGAQTVTGWATAISAGPSNESSQILGFVATNDNTSLFSSQPAVSPSGDLTYTPAANANGLATVSVKLTDDGGTALGGVDTSPVQTFTITVGAVNDVPSFTKGPDQTVLEDSGAYSVSNWATAISKGPADESAQTLSFTTGNDNNALFSVQPGVSPTGTLVYTPAPNAVGSATVTVSLSDTGGTANGGDDTSDAQTFVITVGAVNDAPSFTTAGNQTVLEDAGAQTVNGFVTGTSAGPADESAQTVTVSVVSNDNNGLFSAQPSVTNGVLTYTPAADKNGSATVTVKATDDGGTANGGSDTSLNQQFTITVTAVNDVPSFTKGADQTVNEDAGAFSVSNWATSISRGPADEVAQTVSFTVTNNNNSLFSTQPLVTPTGTLQYTSAPNQYGSATVSVAIVDNGGTANGGDDTSDVQTFTITVNPVNDAPVAAAKSYTVQANMKISLSGLLAGATDPNDSPVPAGQPAYTPSFSVGSVTAGAGCVGCTISNVNNAAGTFDFDPPAGGTGTYTVSYTVVDSGYPAPGATSAPQTITFTVNGPVVWFVDTTAGAGGTGRLSAPFNTLPPATTAMGSNANHRIFVRGGNVTGNVTLPTDGWLISEAATGADFDAVMGFTPPANTIARPAVNGTQRTVTGTVTLGSNSTVRGVDISQTGSNKGLVASGKSGLTVNQMSIATTAGRAVDLASSSGVFSLKKVDSNGADRGISLLNTNVSTGSFTITGSGTTAGSGGTITNSTGTAIGEAGIYLNNTKAVSLSRMNVTNGAGNGIYANTVNGFALDNSTISNNGTNEVNDHSGINGTNVLGTVTLDTITVFGSREDNAKIMNSSGTATIEVKNSTFRDNNASVGANGLYIDSSGNATVTFTSTNNTFQRNHTSGLAIFAQSSQRMNTTVTGGTYVTDNGVGLDIETNGAGGMQFSVQGGTVTGCASCAAPVVIYKGTGATGTGTLGTNGTLNGMTVTNGSSLNAPGIWVHGEGPGSSRLAITNNTVSQVGHYGILVSFGNNGVSPNLGAQSVDVTLTGNNVNHTGITGSLEGIFVDSGLLSADTTVTCANISGNTITQPNDDDIRVRNRQAGTSLRLPGYAGSATDHTAVANFLKAQNTIADAFSGANASSNGIGGGAGCAMP